MKCLIVKLGAMGDVLRTTPLLHRIRARWPNAEIDWATGPGSAPLLEGNPLIAHIYQASQSGEVLRHSYDWAINADEDVQACEILTRAESKIKKGYILHQGRYAPADGDADYAYQLTKDDDLKFKKNTQTYQQTLFQMAGMGDFSGEEMSLNYTSRGAGRGVALNPDVGEKWPTKKWEYWKDLAKSLEPRYPVSWQQHFPQVQEYIEWIDAHKVVLTSDSLGMHLALALKKPTLVFFGPTAHPEVELYGRGVKLYVSDLFCAPCYKAVCPYHHECMTQLSVERVLNTLEPFLKNS